MEYLLTLPTYERRGTYLFHDEREIRRYGRTKIFTFVLDRSNFLLATTLLLRGMLFNCYLRYPSFPALYAAAAAAIPSTQSAAFLVDPPSYHIEMIVFVFCDFLSIVILASSGFPFGRAFRIFLFP